MKKALATLSRSCWRVLAGAGMVFSLSAASLATPLIPGDLDSSGLFIVGDGSISIELLDIADTSGGSEFGFFAVDDPTTLVPIFDGSDLTGESALIDFVNGFVGDVEESAVQSTFDPLPGIIGFYLSVPTLPTLYSVADLNGGVDVMADTLLPSGETGINFVVNNTILSWHVLTDLEVYAAPEPSRLYMLLAGGALMLLAARTGKIARKPVVTD